MILFYLILLVSTAFPNFMPSRVSQWKATSVFCWISLYHRGHIKRKKLWISNSRDIGDRRVSSLLANSRRHMMQLLKTNICRAAVCDKCQKMALQGGKPSRPRLVSVTFDYQIKSLLHKMWFRQKNVDEFLPWRVAAKNSEISRVTKPFEKLMMINDYF